jgi:hypothetical protein
MRHSVAQARGRATGRRLLPTDARERQSKPEDRQCLLHEIEIRRALEAEPFIHPPRDLHGARRVNHDVLVPVLSRQRDAPLDQRLADATFARAGLHGEQPESRGVLFLRRGSAGTVLRHIREVHHAPEELPVGDGDQELGARFLGELTNIGQHVIV